MPKIPRKKAMAIAIEIVDQRGRYWKDQEFKWLMNTFRDRYDPRRLTLALCHCCGLRIHDGVHAKMSDFSENYDYIKIKQCKPNVRSKDGVCRIRIKSRLMPLPMWLVKDITHYIKYRLMLGYYAKVNPSDRLWPSLSKQYIYNYFYKLRERRSEEAPFLKEVWYIEHRKYGDGTTHSIKKYRFAPHAGRAMFSVTATKVCDGSVSDARCITGHDRMKDIERYTRFADVEEKKTEMVDKYFSQLSQEVPIPIVKSQKSLRAFL